MKANIYISIMFTLIFPNLLMATENALPNILNSFMYENMKMTTQTGTVCGHVYNDQNANGQQDVGERDLPNVSVCITDMMKRQGRVITDKNGDYCLSNIPAGVATVDIHEWTLPKGSVMTIGTTDPTTVTIIPNQEVFEENNGYQLPTIPSPTPLTLQVTDAKAIEGETLVFDIHLSHSTNVDVTMNIVSIDGSAIASKDYAKVEKNLTITAGSIGRTVSVSTHDDKIDENNIETMMLIVSVTSGIDGNTQVSATGSIIDNDVMTTADTIKSDTPHVPASVNVLENDTNTTIPTSLVLIPNDNAPLGTKSTDTDSDGDIDTIVVPGEGTWSADNNGTITITPEPGFTADPAPIKYTVDDDQNQTSDPTLIDADYPQTATNTVDDNVTGAVGVPTNINVLDNDTDNELDTNTSSIALMVPADGNGTDTDGDGDIDMVIIPTEGVWTVDENGTVTFTPLSTFTDDPAPIRYTVDDNTALTSEAATIYVDLKQLLRDDNTTSIVQKSVAVAVLQNDDEVNPKTVNLIGIAGSSEDDIDGDGDIDMITVPGEGIWSVNNEGIVTFTPEVNFKDDPSDIRYSARDNNGNILDAATIRIHYIQIGALIEPKAIDDTLNIYSYKLHTSDVSQNDIAGEGGKSEQIYQLLDANGVVVPIGTTLHLKHGEVYMGRNGIYSYRAFANISGGEDTFKYIMKDSANQTSNASVNITIDCASTQLSDNGGLNGIGMWIMFFFMGFGGVYFVRKEV